MRRYQPNSNPNNVPEGTVVRGRNGLYWVSQNVDGIRQWQLYDGRIPSDSESSEEMEINIPEYRPPRTSLDVEPGIWSPIEDQQEPLPQTPEVASNLLRLLNESARTLTRSPSQYNLTDSNERREGIYEEREEPPRTLTRSFAMTDLSDETFQPRTIRYNDDDEISYMSFSTDSNSEDDRFSVYAGQDEEFEYESEYEEDSDDFDDISSDSESVVNYKSNILDKCLNESPVTLMNYEETDLNDLFIVHLPNNEGKFIKGSCLRRDEMRQLLQSDLTTFPPSYIMSIYKTPSSSYPDDLLTGLTGKPTGKIIVRLPTNQIYITFGSMKRILRNPTKQWFALPLYGGKARRVGNVGGIYGASMNHGQVPGFKIYKLFNYNEIKSKVVVKETHDDFPHTMMHDTMMSLFDLVGETPVQIFIQNIINDLIETEIRAQPVIPPRNSSLQSRRERRFGNPPDI